MFNGLRRTPPTSILFIELTASSLATYSVLLRFRSTTGVDGDGDGDGDGGGDGGSGDGDSRGGKCSACACCAIRLRFSVGSIISPIYFKIVRLHHLFGKKKTKEENHFRTKRLRHFKGLGRLIAMFGLRSTKCEFGPQEFLSASFGCNHQRNNAPRSHHSPPLLRCSTLLTRDNDDGGANPILLDGSTGYNDTVPNPPGLPNNRGNEGCSAASQKSS